MIPRFRLLGFGVIFRRSVIPPFRHSVVPSFRLLGSPHISRLFKQTLTFSTYQHCSHPFALKRRRKSVDLSPKSFFQTSKQLFAIQLLPATCYVCPLAIPEFFAQTRVSDYWQLIHFTSCVGLRVLAAQEVLARLLGKY